MKTPSGRSQCNGLRPELLEDAPGEGAIALRSDPTSCIAAKNSSRRSGSISTFQGHQDGALRPADIEGDEDRQLQPGLG